MGVKPSSLGEDFSMLAVWSAIKKVVIRLRFEVSHSMDYQIPQASTSG